MTVRTLTCSPRRCFCIVRPSPYFPCENGINAPSSGRILSSPTKSENPVPLYNSTETPVSADLNAASMTLKQRRTLSGVTRSSSVPSSAAPTFL